MRKNWIRTRQARVRDQAACPVFVDETAIITKMVRLPAAAPFGHWNTQTFIAGLRCDGLSAPWTVDKAIDLIAFGLWIKTQFAPTLSKGDSLPQRRLGCPRQPRRP